MALPASMAPAQAPRQLGDGAGAPRRDETTESRPRLDVVERRRDRTRSVRRQARLLRTMGVLLVVGALGVTAAAHTFVASDQERVDALQLQLSQTLAAQQDLQIARAQLESPARVLYIAEHRLGMVAPGSVSYLAPVNPGPSVEQTEVVGGTNATSAPGSSTGATGGSRARGRSLRTSPTR